MKQLIKEHKSRLFGLNIGHPFFVSSMRIVTNKSLFLFCFWKIYTSIYLCYNNYSFMNMLLLFVHSSFIYVFNIIQTTKTIMESFIKFDHPLGNSFASYNYINLGGKVKFSKPSSSANPFFKIGFNPETLWVIESSDHKRQPSLGCIW